MTSPSASVHATISELDNAFANGTNVLGDVRSLISRLNGQIEGMLMTFTGMARVAFEAQHVEWNSQMTRLTTELERILAATKASADRQRQLEQDSVTAVNAAAG